MDAIVTQQATTASTLADLTESQKVVIASVTTLTEKLDIIASRLERLGDPKTGSPQGNASGTKDTSPRASGSARVASAQTSPTNHIPPTPATSRTRRKIR